MATIKAFSDLQQSKKLAEFLPLESADMYYVLSEDESTNMISFGKSQGFFDKTQVAWSLAALLSVIKDKCGYFEFVYLKRTSDGRANPLEDVHRLSTDLHDVYKKEAVDACYEMIILLHEQNLL